jgi:anti-anti-sigma regulatory factor
VSIALEQNTDSSLIRLDGEIGIALAADLKQLLLEALGSGSAVRVSLEGATGLDVTAVQLLWAAEREARRAGADFALTGAAPEPVLAALGNAGLFEFPVGAGGS